MLDIDSVHVIYNQIHKCLIFVVLILLIAVLFIFICIPTNILVHTQTDCFKFRNKEKLPIALWTHCVNLKFVTAIACHLNGLLVLPLEMDEDRFFYILYLEFDGYPFFTNPAVFTHVAIVLVAV
jgi:hypothetical protein